MEAGATLLQVYKINVVNLESLPYVFVDAT